MQMNWAPLLGVLALVIGILYLALRRRRRRP